MHDAIHMQPIDAFRATIRPPGSKSLTNRALLLAALADGVSHLRYPLIADDSQRMIEALRALGFDITLQHEGETIAITGLAGRIPATAAALHLGNAGTAFRFLTAATCLGRGTCKLDGIARMRERPIGQLVDALRQLGATVDYEANEGFPPLRVTADGLPGGEIELATTLSSQYISALLMAGPAMRDGLVLRFAGPVTSQPYVAMTLALMQQFGITAEVDDAFTRIAVQPGTYAAGIYDIEPDASSASYFLAAGAAVPGSTCTIEGLGRRSLQGDVAFADVLHEMGAGLVFGPDFITVMAPPVGQKLRGIDVRMNHIPDTVQTLAAIAPLASSPTTIRDVGNLRVKETDRLEALRIELTKLGCDVTIDGNDLHITPPADGRIQPAMIDTYDDHRMAMSFAVLGLVVEGMHISDPRCVDKSFPTFFDVLHTLGASPVS